MNTKATLASMVLATGSLLSGTAQANDAVLGALLGAGAGAVIGAAVGGHEGAIVGGAIGAVGGAVAARSHTVVGVHGVANPHAGTYAGGAPVGGFTPVHRPVYGPGHGPAYGPVHGPVYGPVHGHGYFGHHGRPPVVVAPARGYYHYGQPRVIVAPPVYVAPPPHVIYVRPRGHYDRHPHGWHGPRY